MGMKREVLRAFQLCVHQDGTTLMENASFVVREGELLSVCGFHDSSKSILSRVLSGEIAYTTGTLAFGTHIPPGRRRAMRIDDNTSLIWDRSIAENLFVFTNEPKSFVCHWQRIYARAAQVLRALNLPYLPSQKVSQMTRAHQHLLLIAKAAEQKYPVVVLENISWGYTAAEYAALLRVMRLYKDLAFIYVINRLDPIVRVSNRVACFQDRIMNGIFFQGTLSDDVFKRMLSGAHTSAMPDLRKNVAFGREVLRLAPADARNTIEISVREGEIVGILDLYGGFWSELRKVFFSCRQYDVWVDGKRVKGLYRALSRGMALASAVSQEMLFPHLDLFDTLTLNTAKKSSRAGVLNHRMQRYTYQRLMAQARGNTSDRMQILLRALSAQPRVVVLENMLLGVKDPLKLRMIEIIEGAARGGTGVLFISTQPAECDMLCDRTLVLHDRAHFSWIRHARARSVQQ